MLATWISQDLSRAVFDAAAWLFRGNTDELTLKLLGALVLVTSLFAYAFRAPFHEPSTPLSLLTMAAGVLFWGAALIVCIGLLNGW